MKEDLWLSWLLYHFLLLDIVVIVAAVVVVFIQLQTSLSSNICPYCSQSTFFYQTISVFSQIVKCEDLWTSMYSIHTILASLGRVTVAELGRVQLRNWEGLVPIGNGSVNRTRLKKEKN